jgi:hypothetical protein
MILEIRMSNYETACFSVILVSCVIPGQVKIVFLWSAVAELPGNEGSFLLGGPEVEGHGWNPDSCIRCAFDKTWKEMSYYTFIGCYKSEMMSFLYVRTG